MKNKVSYKGVKFLDLLGLLFIYLKLTGQIDWYWQYVLMPIWIPLALAIISAIILVVLETMQDKKYRKKDNEA